MYSYKSQKVLEEPFGMQSIFLETFAVLPIATCQIRLESFPVAYEGSRTVVPESRHLARAFEYIEVSRGSWDPRRKYSRFSLLFDETRANPRQSRLAFR